MNKIPPPSKETVIRYLHGKCTPVEAELVEVYLAMDIDKEYVEACIAEVWDQLGSDKQIDGSNTDLERFQLKLSRRAKEVKRLPPLASQENKSRVFRLANWVKLIAAVMLLIGGMTLIMHYNKIFVSEYEWAKEQSDINPGSDQAVLTLADGSTISLSKTQNGHVAMQDGLEIDKANEGELVYRNNTVKAGLTNSFNSISTPKGGQFAVTLADGSKAILNAGSSLTYPVQFSDKERRVKMTGEVYFEIAKATNEKNEKIPFFVETDRQLIQVLGTTFNVSAYTDEQQHTTTLLEGSIQLKTTEAENSPYVLLKPGQQAMVKKDIKVSTANVKQRIAWVEGYFIFQDEELESILHKLSRWYDIEVDCDTRIGKTKFTGKVSRSQPLSAVVDMLVATGKINVQLKERRLTVK